MKLKVKRFIYHKEKESVNDCNDRIDVNFATNKFAISDGVTSSFLPSMWAELLVREFVATEGPLKKDDPLFLSQIQDKWFDEAEKFANKDGQAWFIKTFFEEGRSAAATFAGIHFYLDNQKPYWEAVAIGDSFLFFIRGTTEVQNVVDTGNLEIAVPDKTNFTFDNYPEHLDSISSKPKGKYSFITDVALQEGTFLLMTDALAEWFIKDRPNAMIQIKQWDTHESFIKHIKKLRRSKKINNDDSSILIIEVTDNGKTDLNYEYLN